MTENTPHSNRPSRATRWLLLLVSLTLALGALLGHSERQPVLNSDNLYVFEMVRDTLLQPTRIIGYDLGPAPYFFPDVPLTAVAGILAGGEPGLTHAIYSLLFLFALTLTLDYWIEPMLPEFDRRQRLTLISVGHLGLIVAPFLTAHPAHWGEGASRTVGHFWMDYLMTPGSHGGALLGGLALCAIFFRSALRGMTVVRWLAMLGIGTALVASDLFVLPQFLAPIGVMALLLAATRLAHWSLPLTTLPNLALCAYLGQKAVRETRELGWAHVPKEDTQLSLEQLWLTAPRLGDSLVDLTTGAPWYPLVVLAMGGFVAWGLMRAWMEWSFFKRDEAERRRALNCAFSPLMVGAILSATLLTPLMSGRWEDLNNLRYVLPWLYLPFVYVGVAGGAALWRRRPESAPRWLAGGVGVAASVLLVALALPPYRGVAMAPRDTQLALADYVKEHGLRAGYANYWYARPFNCRVEGLDLCEIAPWIEHNFWMSNPNHFYQMNDDDEAVYRRFDYILMNGIERERTLDRFGEPRLVKTFEAPGEETLEIFVYDRPEDLEFRNLVRASVWKRCFDKEIGDLGYACNHPSLLEYKGDGARRDSRGVVFFEEGETPLIVTFTPAVSGDTIEILADRDDRYEATFYGGGKALGTTQIPARESGGQMRQRILKLPDSVAGRPVDRVDFRGLRGSAGVCALGYVYLYTDSRTLAADPTARPTKP